MKAAAGSFGSRDSFWIRIRSEKGAWTELNAINGEITMRPIEVGQEVLIVIGEGLCEAKIRSYLESA